MDMKKIGIIGSGIVGKTLASGFKKNGYEVKVGTRNPEKLSDWLNSEEGKDILSGAFEETAEYGDIIVLAVKGNVAKDVVRLIKPHLGGKTIIDTTNPIADNPPEEGVLEFFTDFKKSLMEDLQSIAPEAKFVKAFNSVGSAFMINPDFESRPTMFICGNNDEAKTEVIDILESFNWDSEDMGSSASARAIEPLCILWCIPGFKNNQWSHAFKLLKK